MVTNVAAVKKIKFVAPKARNAKSREVRAAGDIIRIQTHTPITQTRLISSEDLRLTMRMISGILKNGRIKPAIAPMFTITSINILQKTRFILGLRHLQS